MTPRMTAALLAGAVALSLHGAGLAQTAPAPASPAPAPTAPAPTAKDVKDRTAEAWEALKGYTHASKNDAVAYGKKLIKQTDAEIKQSRPRRRRRRATPGASTTSR